MSEPRPTMYRVHYHNPALGAQGSLPGLFSKAGARLAMAILEAEAPGVKTWKEIADDTGRGTRRAGIPGGAGGTESDNGGLQRPAGEEYRPDGGTAGHPKTGAEEQ